MPTILQALVAPAGRTRRRRRSSSRLGLARRRAEAAARDAGLEELAVVVGVVADRRLQGPRRRRAPRSAVPGPGRSPRGAVRAVPPALRDEHAAGLVARPAVPVRRPQRRDQHGARQSRGDPRPSPRRGHPRTPPRGRRPPARRRSAPLARRLRLALARRGDRAPRRDRLVRRAALLALVPEAAELRRSPHPAVAAFRRRVAGFVAPWDGPGAFVFSDGRRVGALLDRNGLRPAAVGDRATASSPSRPRQVPSRSPPADIVRPAGSRRASCSSSTRRPGASSTMPTRSRGSSGGCRSTTRRASRSRTSTRARVDLAADSSARRPGPRRLTDPGTRYLFGLDAERLRLDVRAMALDAQEPLWSMGDDTPLAA